MTFIPSFTADSYFNTPIGDQPVDANSAAMIATQAKHCPPPTIGNPVGNWAIPWSEAKRRSKVATIQDARGNVVKLGIDINVGLMVGDDAAIVFRDLFRGLEVGTFETNVPRKADGTVDVTKVITCTAFSVYYTATNGLARQVGGDKRNTGHRGVPPSIMALHPGEVDGVFRVLKTALGQPADHPGPNFPMYGIENPRDGGIPEGARLRYMGEITNPLLQAAHDYGFLVGDTGSQGSATIKTVQNGAYSPDVLKGLDGTTWDQWVVMELGWH